MGSRPAGGAHSRPADQGAIDEQLCTRVIRVSADLAVSDIGRATEFFTTFLGLDREDIVVGQADRDR